MTYLDKVTITGPDDSTDIQQILDLSAEFPFVEWGILVSKSQEGSYRFPTRAWQQKLVKLSTPKTQHFSTHICGRWVREILKHGAPLEKDWDFIPALHISKRIQINTHAEPHEANLVLLYEALSLLPQTFIFQWEGVNDGISLALAMKGMKNVAALYDISGGAGILPPAWPTAHVGLPVGYAGGLGPENIEAELPKIEAAAEGKKFWIDMERRVRTQDDSALDMSKVRSVLEHVSDYRLNNGLA